MRSTVGPSRTRRPRSAKGSRRKGWTRSSDLGSSSSDKFNNSDAIDPSPALRGREEPIQRRWEGEGISDGGHPHPPSGFALRHPLPNEVSMGGRGKYLAQAPGKDALLHMQPVFRLVPDDRLRAVDAPRRHFLPALGGKAMH